MKTTKFLLVLFFVFGICSIINAQSKVEKIIDEECDITLKGLVDGEVVYYPVVGVEIVKITPSGNLLRTVTLRLADEEIMELANPIAFFSVTATGDFDGDGEDEVLKDTFSVLTKSGNLKLVYHLNGN